MSSQNNIASEISSQKMESETTSNLVSCISEASSGVLNTSPKLELESEIEPDETTSGSPCDCDNRNCLRRIFQYRQNCTKSNNGVRCITRYEAGVPDYYSMKFLNTSYDSPASPSPAPESNENPFYKVYQNSQSFLEEENADEEMPPLSSDEKLCEEKDSESSSLEVNVGSQVNEEKGSENASEDVTGSLVDEVKNDADVVFLHELRKRSKSSVFASDVTPEDIKAQRENAEVVERARTRLQRRKKEEEETKRFYDAQRKNEERKQIEIEVRAKIEAERKEEEKKREELEVKRQMEILEKIDEKAVEVEAMQDSQSASSSEVCTGLVVEAASDVEKKRLENEKILIANCINGQTPYSEYIKYVKETF